MRSAFGVEHTISKGIPKALAGNKNLDTAAFRSRSDDDALYMLTRRNAHLAGKKQARIFGRVARIHSRDYLERPKNQKRKLP